MATRGMTQAGMKQHESIKVGIERLEHARFMERMIVLDKRGDLHVVRYPILDDRSKGVGRGPLGQRKFVVPAGHGLGTDEDDVERGAGEHVCELDPHRAGKRRVGAGGGGAAAGGGGGGGGGAPWTKMRRGGGVGRRPLIPEPAPDRGGWSVYRSAATCQQERARVVSRCVPLMLFKPSTVSLPPERMLYGLNS